LTQVAQQQSTTGKVVAELKFVFWEKMLTSRHDERIWNDHLKTVFPYAPDTLNTAELRTRIYTDVFKIRKLRNRIAHHEPIFVRDLQAEYDTIFELIQWRDQATANWMDEFQQVKKLLAEEPS
jgi:hypothetical protein